MRTLRILLISVMILGVLFVGADRVTVRLAQDKVASKMKTAENLASTPEVSIKGFPFLTQLASGGLDDVEFDIKDYEADTNNGGNDERSSIRIDDLKAQIKDVMFADDYSSATVSSASGTATIAYDELLKAAKSHPTQILTGVTAQVVSLSDGGNGKIRAAIKFHSPLGTQTYAVLNTITVDGNEVKVRADNLPKLVAGLGSARAHSITDFHQSIDQLPTGMKLDSVRATKDGLKITVKGSNVNLAEL
ncbi:DUF2993 domain-containing protein [Streptomyces sp. NPDC088847]|uniref:LmeA family phospholipid-binding protein n=1 Tax=Streptomyces sp. NPDC088847 TaxID=3365909 RepID=UPI00380C676D